jgi:hypothetical protein
MALRIKRGAQQVWMLVKVPLITEDERGGDYTEKRLRETIRENHFGGERAAVRRITQKERRAIEFVRSSRPRKAAAS